MKKNTKDKTKIFFIGGLGIVAGAILGNIAGVLITGAFHPSPLGTVILSYLQGYFGSNLCGIICTKIVDFELAKKAVFIGAVITGGMVILGIILQIAVSIRGIESFILSKFLWQLGASIAWAGAWIQTARKSRTI